MGIALAFNGSHAPGWERKISAKRQHTHRVQLYSTCFSGKKSSIGGLYGEVRDSEDDSKQCLDFGFWAEVYHSYPEARPRS
jgi:hypothetical protein